MSELHEIDGIIFGGEKYTVGASGEVPEGLIDPMDIEWVGEGGYTVGELINISPANIPVKLPDIDSGGNYITSISNYNFGQIAKLLSGVILPSHLVEVPSSLFDGGQLEFVEFGDHITSIGFDAFRNNQLTSLDLPDSLTDIGSDAFQNNQITSVDLPDSLTSIGIRAFENNPLEEVSVHIDTTYNSNSFPSSAVITIRIPEGYIFGEGLTSIESDAYRDKSLTGAITIADSVTSIGSSAFRYNQLTSMVFPESLTSIGNWAFDGNQITSVVIPDSITSIGLYAFRDNPLTEVSIGPNTTYESSSFPSDTKINLRIPEGYIFGEGLTSIRSQAYRNKGLTGEITIADGITSIGSNAFGGNQITSLDLPESLTTIESSAFSTNQLTSVVIPDSVISIGNWAFWSNPLTEVSIGPNTSYQSSSFPSSAVITVRD